ncbi:MAG: 5'/3'-nucleotidase SurE [Chloroflexi bacterium]|nr:5'/3'-nucleotidase SurE [Chloroflexota bacterium]
MNTEKTQILLTNDDGILSPGLWAAAGALEALGYVTVVAPREQSSGAGRSLPATSDGIITPKEVQVNGKTWTVYAVGGSPAQAVLHGALEVMPRAPDLVVSGINYGANIGSGTTVSGTVGAALEAAALGIPALAISVDTEVENHLSYSTEVDFSAAAYFAAYFGKRLLEKSLPPDVHVLKVEIPANATPETPWEVTRISPVRFYQAIRPERDSWDQPTQIRYRVAEDWEQTPPESDVHALYIKQVVAVTPLSLDLTSRVPLDDLADLLRG